MSTVTIYGASDDLIEIEGDLSEEFSLGSDAGRLALGDGTILDFRCDTFGVWRFTRAVKGAGTAYHHDEDPGDDENRYSDRVTLTGDLRWIALLETEAPLHPIGASS